MHKKKKVKTIIVEKYKYDNDDIGAAATAVIAQGGHGYNLLLEARDRFKEILLSSASHYRICIEEDEEKALN